MGGIWLLASTTTFVPVEMCDQRGLVGKLFSAEVTAVLLLPGVGHLMGLEVRL